MLFAAALVAALGGCKNSLQLFQDNNEGGWFSKPLDLFHKPDWAVASAGDMSAPLTPTTAIAPEELVGADGRCAPSPKAAAAAPPPPPDRPVGSISGDLARAPMAAPVSNTPLLGGVALGMSECEVVRRAGPPSNVNISAAGEQGGRRVVLTYSGGTWPGIYTFDAGRLKVVDRAPDWQEVPQQPEPVKTKKAKKATKPKTAATPATRQLN